MNDNNNYDKRMENLRRLGVSSSIIDEVEKAGRNSDIMFVNEDSVGTSSILTISFGDARATAATIAKEHLAAVLSSIGKRFHHLDVIKYSNTIALDTQFCEAIQSGLKNLKGLEISYLQHWDASEVDALLQHMPSGLSKLTVYGPGLTCSPLAQKIPLLLPNLRALELRGEDANFISEFLEEWAALIGRLTSLESLVFDEMCNKKEHWNPILLAIQMHPSLKSVKFESLYTEDFGTIKFDKEIEDSILCRLAINKANAQLKPEDTDSGHPTLEKWVNAVVDSRHQVGCLDYLLSSFDPTIYAPAAIKVLQGSSHKRKIERAYWSEEGLDERHQEFKRQRQLGQEERVQVFGYYSE